MVFSAEIHS